MFPWDKQFPFGQSGFTKQLNKMNPKEVENYIQQVMKNVFGGDYSHGDFPSQGEYSQKESPNIRKPEIFETSDYVYVNIPLTDTDREAIKLQHTTHQLFIINFPKESEQTKYMLPSPVKRKGTKARFLDDRIEIQFIKLSENSLSEIDIT
ncbi:spore gernimation protein GerT [Bacillus sp. UMB0899]|uniref:Hsp20/alpha crystallin family protein n=1 Tax=Metabacillus schmidteae TaxID=2730405 RepID=UPI000C7FB23B|nr:Hsp20/alpha crystallin family protein [Metabacillus schmidteae]PMC39210.1 spore gernimation protein GerT [Bacillus sp. UMB0899]